MQTKNIQTNITMRFILPISIVAMILASCGAPAPSGDLAKLQSTRDSLKALKGSVTEQLAAVEAQINALDTNAMSRVTNVTVLALAPKKFEHFFTVQGTVETDQNAQIFPEAAGKITSIWVKEGTKVTKGQTLLSIDNSIVVRQMEELKARLTLAETVFKKQEQLWNQKIGSEIQYLEAKNNFEALQQNLKTLAAQNDLYTITAPFNGIVDEINLKEGEMAAPQMPAFRLINTDNMYIKADVTERYLSSLQKGDSVEVLFPSLGASASTTISRLGDYINPNNRTFKMRLELPSEKIDLKPNLLGELKVRDYFKDSAIVIPSSLVQMTPSGDEFVYLLEGDHAKKVMIKTGLGYSDIVEVAEGLSANDQLIVKGARAIKDGEQVSVLNP
jgi:membrane fusion protein (multidrug efflux system)